MAFLGAGALLLVSLANEPDRELRFDRELPSHTEIATLEKAVEDPAHWPLWFHQLQSVEKVKPSPAGKDFGPGAVIKLVFDSKKSPWSRFELLARLDEFTSRKISLSILEDSKGKLTTQFDRLEWSVALEPGAGEEAETDGTGNTGVTRITRVTRIKGSAAAHTRNWRSRVFGALATKILMNQVYYPNLIKLSELTAAELKDSVKPPTSVPSPSPNPSPGPLQGR